VSFSEGDLTGSLADTNKKTKPDFIKSTHLTKTFRAFAPYEFFFFDRETRRYSMSPANILAQLQQLAR
jgi:hypothetical protein